jgi:hypothetical protein
VKSDGLKSGARESAGARSEATWRMAAGKGLTTHLRLVPPDVKWVDFFRAYRRQRQPRASSFSADMHVVKTARKSIIDEVAVSRKVEAHQVQRTVKRRPVSGCRQRRSHRVTHYTLKRVSMHIVGTQITSASTHTEQSFSASLAAQGSGAEVMSVSERVAIRWRGAVPQNYPSAYSRPAHYMHAFP